MRRAPACTKLAASCQGCSEYTVLRERSPSARRTACPSSRSIAGITSTADATSLPTSEQECSQKAKAVLLALLGVKLAAEDVLVAHCSGEGDVAVGRGPHHVVRGLGVDV